MGGGETWRLRPGQMLRHRGWDEEYVLYNDLSGDTHLLDGAAIELLQALAAAPASRAELAALLDQRFDLGGLDPERETAALLEHLQRLYLIDTAAC